MSSMFLTILPSLFGVPGNKEQLISHVVRLTVTVLHGQVLFTACKLKLFDVLKDQGPLQAADVARKLSTCAGRTEQLLGVCAALGLLEKTRRGYGNTEVATLHLVSDGEHSLQGLAEYNDAHVWGVFTRLGLAMREGADQTRGILGAMEEERLSQVLLTPVFLFTPRLCCERTSGHGNISDSGRCGNPCGRPPWRGGCGWLVTAPEKRAFLGRGCLESRHRVSYVELHCTDSWFLAQRRVCKGLPGPSPAPWHPRPLFTVVWEGRGLRGSWVII
ncbi:acetylserotonin O-methyltransferase-like [Monodon monoceros]|uniref:acetylserotonin O-methyltransferase-like n=1 Tax=Monodon monoceros TaxID=40151 RepID=UPI0010F9464F|nr:acetylserotonin O-methyltransferase-like [Monodon monoceros]